MTEKIHVTFQDGQIAQLAQHTLQNNGFSEVFLNFQDGTHHLTLNTEQDRWIAAFEILNSYGALLMDKDDLNFELEEQYHLDEQLPLLYSNPESPDEHPLDDREWGSEELSPRSIYEKKGVNNFNIIDENAVIDPNIGYGDFELLEPYILDTFQKENKETNEEI